VRTSQMEYIHTTITQFVENTSCQADLSALDLHWLTAQDPDLWVVFTIVIVKKMAHRCDIRKHAECVTRVAYTSCAGSTTMDRQTES
jgi:hypothetical protein